MALTTALKKASLVLGRKYKVVGQELTGYFSIGDIVEYVRDDGSYNPEFRNITTGREGVYVHVDWLEEFDPFDNLKIGDIISEEGCEERYMVFGIYADNTKVALADLYDDSLDHRMKTMEQLRDGYWVKGHKPEEEVTELTLQEVADKVGVDVSKLRIKE